MGLMNKFWNDPVTQRLAESLLKFSVSQVHTKGKEISIRCPICGDSRKHRNSTHFFIKMEPPYPYYCQRCKSFGLINHSFLQNIGIYDSELYILIKAANREIKKSNRLKYKTHSKKELVIPDPSLNKINKIKLAYINSRLGINLSLEDLKNFKIILNLYDLLDANEIEYLTCSERMADTLDHNFIGFISYDNNYVIMRNLSKKELTNLRYYNYNIFGNYDNSRRFYTIPNKIDILSPVVNVVTAEGVFDILGIYFNILKQNKENTIFVAVNGIGVNFMLKNLFKMGFLDINLSIYADSDNSLDEFKKMKKSLGDAFDSHPNIYNTYMVKKYLLEDLMSFFNLNQ